MMCGGGVYGIAKLLLDGCIEVLLLGLWGSFFEILSLLQYGNAIQLIFQCIIRNIQAYVRWNRIARPMEKSSPKTSLNRFLFWAIESTIPIPRKHHHLSQISSESPPNPFYQDSCPKYYLENHCTLYLSRTITNKQFELISISSYRTFPSPTLRSNQPLLSPITPIQ